MHSVNSVKHGVGHGVKHGAPRRVALLVSSLVALGGCGGGDETPDAAAAPDAPALDAPATSDAPLDDAPIALDAASSDDASSSDDAFSRDDAGPAPGCGGMRPDVSSVTGTEGLVITRDGTIYYSQSAAIGRVAPDGTIDDAFAALPRSARQVWGIVPNADNTHLYVGSPSTGAIYDVDLTSAPASVSTLVTGVGGPNGLTLGPDGALYVSDFSGGRVLRIALDAAPATPTVVATIPSANGVAFDDAGHLLVCNYGSGQLIRLTLSGGVESARETAASGLGSPDGVALDRDGTLYVTDNGRGRLLRVEADGSTTALLTGVPQAASVEFGAGALDCEDVYVASGGSIARWEMGTIPGRAVPWH